MTQEQIIKEAAALAKSHNYSGIIAALSDGNFFFITSTSDINAVVQHLRGKGHDVPVHVIDTAVDPHKHSVSNLKDLVGRFSSEDAAEGAAAGDNDHELGLENALTGDQGAFFALTFEDLNAATVAQLKELAQVHKVDLGKTTKKAEVIEVILDFISAETTEGDEDDAEEALKAEALNSALDGDLSKLKIAEVKLEDLDNDQIIMIAVANGIEVTDASTKESLIDQINAKSNA